MMRLEPQQVTVQQRGESLRITGVAGQRLTDELAHGQVSEKRESERTGTARNAARRNTVRGTSVVRKRDVFAWGHASFFAQGAGLPRKWLAAQAFTSISRSAGSRRLR